MISHELAEALKKAGLPWEPKLFDHLYHNQPGVDCYGEDGIVTGLHINSLAFFAFYPSEEKEVEHDLSWQDIAWLPSLSDLLHGIEARGYECRSSKNKCEIWQGPLNDVTIYCTFIADAAVDADARCNAAAIALLWVLKEAVV